MPDKLPAGSANVLDAAGRRKIIERLATKTAPLGAVATECMTTRFKNSVPDTGGKINVQRQQPKNLQITQLNSDPLTIAPPYGYLPFANKASQEQLKAAITFCERKKQQYANYGWPYYARAFGLRQMLFAGLLKQAVKMGLK